MIYLLLFILCVSVCWMLVIYMPFREMNPLKHMLEANNLFCIQYLIFSCCFLFFESFAVWKSLICVLAFSVAIMFVLMLKRVSRKRWHYVKISRQEIVLILVTVFMVLPFIYITSEDISADTDQGAYFLHTSILMEEKSKEIHSLQEIGKFSGQVDKGIRELLEDLPSFCHEDNEDVYYIHALNSWCSYSALFGKMFGIWNSMRAVNYLYILLVGNLFYVCKRNALNQYNVYLYIVMFALSPLLLYIGKAGLSEIAVLYFVTLGLNYLFEDKMFFAVVGGVCIGSMGFTHISMYAYVPIITGMALLESTYIKRIAWFNITQLLMFGVSVWYAYMISPIYMKRQYMRFTLDGKIDYLIVFILIDLIVLAGVCLQIYIICRRTEFIFRTRKIIYENFRQISLMVWGIILVSTIYYAYFMCFTDKFRISDGVDAGTWNLRSRYINQGIMSISHLNFINISRAVGVIGMLIFIMIPFVRHEVSDAAKIFYYIALYGMVIFTVLQMDTPSNYYCSRYFVPVLIPMIVLSVVSAVESKNWCIYFIMMVLIYSHRFMPAFLMGAPKVGQYKLLQDALEVIPENAIVFCNPESHMINAGLSGNLRIQNDNEIYNLDNMDEVLAFSQNNNNSAYIISESELEVDAKLIKSNIYISQYSFGNGPNGTYDTKTGTYQIPLFIYQIFSYG